ncbi:MAG: class I SAM-dependent methyltransferase [Flavobacteriales bacterium]
MEHTITEAVLVCPVCAGAGQLPFLSVRDNTVSRATFDLTCCDQCGFCSTNPRPTRGVIGGFYDSADYISHTNASSGIRAWAYQKIRRRAIKGKHRLIAKHSPRGKALDVGCGTGEFLAYLKSKGYQPIGVEPSVKARDQAIGNHALRVVPNLDALPTDAQFEVVTLWHALEHVHDVRETLNKLHTRMSPGALLVIAVPDRESWDARHYAADWAAYDVPRHLSHFRRKDLHRLLADHGFKVLATRPMWYDAFYVSMLSEPNRGSGPLAALVKGAIVGALSNLVALTTTYPTSSSLYLAEKR